MLKLKCRAEKSLNEFAYVFLKAFSKQRFIRMKLNGKAKVSIVRAAAFEAENGKPAVPTFYFFVSFLRPNFQG